VCRRQQGSIFPRRPRSIAHHHLLLHLQILTAAVMANNLSIQVSSAFVNKWGAITASRLEGVVNLQSAKQSAAVNGG
jgi:hypothetical protein